MSFLLSPLRSSPRRNAPFSTSAVREQESRDAHYTPGRPVGSKNSRSQAQACTPARPASRRSASRCKTRRTSTRSASRASRTLRSSLQRSTASRIPTRRLSQTSDPDPTPRTSCGRARSAHRNAPSGCHSKVSDRRTRPPFRATSSYSATRRRPRATSCTRKTPNACTQATTRTRSAQVSTM